MSQKLSALLIIVILLIGTVSVSSNFALADDKNKNKTPKTLQDFCATLDDKNGFPSLVCTAISSITISIQNLQDQINQMQFTAQRCPPGQEMVGINVNRQIICENTNFQSTTSVIVTINPVSVQISPNPNSLTSIALAAVGLSPNSQVIVDDGLGHQIATGTSDNKGGFSITIQIPTFGSPQGSYALRVTDSNGKTGSAMFALTTPPPQLTCVPPQVLDTTTNTCITPPPPSLTCTPPQVLNIVTNTCVIPTATVTLTPPTGSTGTQVTLTASGLTPNSTVTVTVMGVTVGTGTSDSSGNFTFGPISVPPLPPGNIPVTVYDSGGISGTAMFLKT